MQGKMPENRKGIKKPTHQLRGVDAHAHDAHAHLCALLDSHAVGARHVRRVVGAAVLIVLGDELRKDCVCCVWCAY